MRFLLEKTEALERRLKVTVPADDVDQQVKKRLKKIGGRVRIDGFRKGKIPFDIIMQSQHAVVMRAEVLSDVITKAYYDALQKSNLKPAGEPNLEIKVNEAGKDLEFEASFELYPEIKLEDFSVIEVEKPEATIEEKDIDKMVEALRKQQQEWIDAEEGSSVGPQDAVMINSDATIDGDAFEEGTINDQFVVLEQTNLFPEFGENLIGMKVGEMRTFTLNCPDSYEQFKGKRVKFSVTVNKINKSKLPELDENFFKLFGVKEGGKEKFREEVRKNMTRELKDITHRTLKKQIWESLLKIHPISLPGKLVQEECEQLYEQFKQHMAELQKDTGKTDDLQVSASNFKEEAERRVHLGIIMSEIVRLHKIELDNKRLSEKLLEIASSYQDPEAVIQCYRKNDRLLSQLQHLVLENQVIDFILEKVQVKPKACSYEEVVFST